MKVAVDEATLAQAVKAVNEDVETVIKGEEHEATTTAVEAALTVLQDAVAFAVIEAPLVKAVNPLFVQAPDATVVVPKELAPLNTSMVVASASELVPDTEVAPVQMADTTGAVDAEGDVHVRTTFPDPPGPPIQATDDICLAPPPPPPPFTPRNPGWAILEFPLPPATPPVGAEPAVAPEPALPVAEVPALLPPPPPAVAFAPCAPAPPARAVLPETVGEVVTPPAPPAPLVAPEPPEPPAATTVAPKDELPPAPPVVAAVKLGFPPSPTVIV